MIMAGNKKKIIRVTTVPMSLKAFCDGMLKELSEKYEVVAVSSPGEDLDLVAEREGVRTIAVPMERHISLGKDMKSLWLMTKVLRKEKPDVVHSMTPKAGLVTMLAGWLAGVPVRIHTFTGLVWPTSKGLKRKILMATDRLTCACATHVIPEGLGVMSDLKKGNITKKPLKVLGYGNVKGVDMVTIDPKRFEKVKHDTFDFLFVGRIVGDKGINELVEAFTRLHDKYQNTRLILVGFYEKELDPVTELTNNRIAANPSIVVAGPKFGDELLQAYVDADCHVMPSYREGFPNTVLEAGAMGLPQVVTDINGSREIVVDGVNGLIVPPQNADALYEAMIKMIEDDDARNKMATVARKMIGDRFERSFVRKCLYDFYEERLND